MVKSDLLTVLGKLGIYSSEIYETKPGQFQICCPMAKWTHLSGADSNPSMGIDFSGDFVKYNCFTCGESGKLWLLVYRIAQKTKSEELFKLSDTVFEKDGPNLTTKLQSAMESWEPKEKKKEDEPLPDKLLDHFVSVFVHDDACEYLEKRKIPEATWDKFGLVFDNSKKRILLPVRDSKGRLRGAVGRAIYPDTHPKYYNYFNFNRRYWLGGMNNFSNDRKKLALVEGYFCLLRASQWVDDFDVDVACIFGSKMADEQCDLAASLDKSISIWFDNDPAGNDGWVKTKEKMERRHVRVKRANLQLNEDVDTMDKSRFGEVLENLRRLR